MMFALTWRCDGSEGVKWYLRGIKSDGSFHGEIRFQSADQSRCIATWVTGQLSPDECARMNELTEVIRQQPPPVASGPHFAALFERLSSTNAGDVRRLFEYHHGEEANSESSRAFIELISLIERHLLPCYAKIGAERIPGRSRR